MNKSILISKAILLNHLHQYRFEISFVYPQGFLNHFLLFSFFNQMGIFNYKKQEILNELHICFYLGKVNLILENNNIHDKILINLL
jgi:hypothetical protein